MVMDTGLDTGAVFANMALPIGSDDTMESLTANLASAGAALVESSLADYVDGSIVPVEQPRERASMTRPLVKADGWIDWSTPASEIERLTRAMWPWPRAWTTLDGEPFQIHRCSVVDLPDEAVKLGETGTILRAGSDLSVRCGDREVTLERVQRAGGRPIDGRELLRTQPHLEGARLGREGGPSRLPGPFVTVLE